MMRSRHSNGLRDNVWWLGCVGLAALIQTNWPEFLKFQDASPDITLALVVYFSIAFGEERAMFTGLLGGLYLDVAVTTTLGHHVLCYVFIGYVAGRLSTRLITEHAAVKGGLVLFAGICQGLAYVAIQYVQQPHRGMLYPILNSVVPAAFYSAIIAPLVFMSLEALFEKRGVVSDGIM